VTFRGNAMNPSCDAPGCHARAENPANGKDYCDKHIDGRRPRRVTYVAHCLSAPTRAGIEENRADAARWAAFLGMHFSVAPECSWIVLTGMWDETPENRARGLECDLALVERCDELVMVGPRVSEGMMLESEHARKHGKPVYDLTRLSMDPETVALAWVPGEVKAG